MYSSLLCIVFGVYVRHFVCQIIRSWCLQHRRFAQDRQYMQKKKHFLNKQIIHLHINQLRRGQWIPIAFVIRFDIRYKRIPNKFINNGKWISEIYVYETRKFRIQFYVHIIHLCARHLAFGFVVVCKGDSLYMDNVQYIFIFIPIPSCARVHSILFMLVNECTWPSNRIHADLLYFVPAHFLVCIFLSQSTSAFVGISFSALFYFYFVLDCVKHFTWIDYIDHKKRSVSKWTMRNLII